jgi:hypothetical protein
MTATTTPTTSPTRVLLIRTVRPDNSLIVATLPLVRALGDESGACRAITQACDVCPNYGAEEQFLYRPKRTVHCPEHSAVRTSTTATEPSGPSDAIWRSCAVSRTSNSARWCPQEQPTAGQYRDRRPAVPVRDVHPRLRTSPDVPLHGDARRSRYAAPGHPEAA